MESKKNEAQGAKGKEVVTAGNVTAEAKKTGLPKEDAKKVLTIREQLELQLKQLNRKKELADKRELFMSKKTELLRYKEYVLKDFGQLETKAAKVSFIGCSESGRDETRVNVNNPAFIARYIDCLVSDIDRFVVEIEQELLTDIA
jgi:hypothetical protein